MEVSGKKAKQIPSTSILQGSDNDAQFYCIPCEQEGHCVQAHGYCQNCAEYLCETCYRSHRKPAPCRNHVLLDSSKMPKSQKYQRSHPVAHDLVEPCPKHQGEIIKYYCHDHAFFGCSPCITINHRACKADYIPDVSENFVVSQEYTNLLHSLKTLCNSCKEIAVTTKENKREIKKRTKDLRGKTGRFRQDINHTLDKWEMELNEKVEQIFEKESTKAESVETECNEASTEVQKLQCDIETLHKSSKLNELFIKVKKNENNLKEYAELIDQMQEKTTVSDVTFKPNLAIERMLSEETSIGQLKLKQDDGSKCLSTTAKEQPYKHHKEPAMERKQQNLDRQAGGQNTNTRKVSDKEAVSHKQQTIMTEVKDQENSEADVYDNITTSQSGKIKIQTEQDSTDCYITGMAVISRDKLAIADYENSSIKIVDTKQSTILSARKLNYSPWDVVLLPADELAVTIPESYMIQVLSISDQLSTKRQIKVEGICQGLSYFNQNFVVTFRLPTKVEILTVQGDLLMTFMNDQSFQMLHHIAADDSKNLIYVSDAQVSSNKIACLGLNGEVTRIYKDSKLDSPRGLAVLKDGSLLVASFGSSKICLVSPDFKNSRVLQKADGICMPESVALDREQKKLYVGSCSDNFLLMYELKW